MTGTQTQSATRLGSHSSQRRLMRSNPSGANNLAGAMTRTLENLLEHPGQRYQDVDDVVNVRIYQGIHFRAGDELARKRGTAAAD